MLKYVDKIPDTSSLKLLFHQTDDDDYENSEFLEQGAQEQAAEQEDDGKYVIRNICLLRIGTKKYILWAVYLLFYNTVLICGTG